MGHAARAGLRSEPLGRARIRRAGTPARPFVRPRFLSNRALGLIGLTAATAGLIAYMVATVDVTSPTLSRAEIGRHWTAAAVGASLVFSFAVLVITVVVRDRELYPEPGDVAAPAPAHPTRIPRSLSWERIPRKALAVSALASAAGVTVAAIAGAHLWIGGLCLLLPWVPLVAGEAVWKYKRYGIFAGFALIVLLQVLHMGEHTMQVFQLLASGGELARSHGAFGQLDFELVHFVTDTALWITLGLLLIIYQGRNGWLWVAFAAASLHQVEHLYLFWIYTFHESFYMQGGFAGIMGQGGLIGTLLDRPYLHFSYNYIVVVPMVLALWDEARRVDSRQAERL